VVYSKRDGADKENIGNAILEQCLFDRVILLGYVTDLERDMLFHTCDVFVQPNIKVDDDIEGFGISVIEAAFCGIPVIASRLEGLQDAIKDGMNGFLVEPCDVQAWVTKINEILAISNFRKSFGEKARQFIIENYRWEEISRKYLQEIEKVIKRA
jgi:phosphatidylinositol alpha-1,6-mannosyltransferase